MHADGTDPVGIRPGFWDGRRVLVTGHTGFKGAWLSLWLQALGADVSGLSAGQPHERGIFAAARVGEHMRNVDGDVRDPDAVNDAVARSAPEIVVHLAAQPLVRASFEDPRATFETNVMGTVNLLDAVRGTRGSTRVVLVVTSDKCYESREWEWGYRENDPLGGHDPYSSSKAAQELVCSAYRSSFFDAGDAPRLATARAGNVIGGGDWAPDRLLPDLMRAACSGAAARVRNPGAVRPWQHVLAPLGGYLLLAQALWHGREHARAWNFGPADDDARTVRWVVQRVAELWPGLRVESDTGAHPRETRWLKLDSSRARQSLGWAPAQGLPEALASTVAWYREQQCGGDMRALSLAQIEASGSRMAEG